MELMLDAPEQDDPDAAAPDEPETDAAEAALAAPPESAPEPRCERFGWLPASTRRALLLTALGGLLIAGLITALPIGGSHGVLGGYLKSDPLPGSGLGGNEAFGKANAGDCLSWPGGTPDSAAIVDCNDDHRFEVAQLVDMRTFPGSEYGADAAPPSPARIQQIVQEQCEVAVQRYLGPKFDPNSRFTVSMLWSGDKAWKQHGERRMLCGLQLPGPDGEQMLFKGKVAEVDQSKVWPDGTCLGIDPASNQTTDVPVDCASPHAMEVTGTVNVADKFPGGVPAEPDQDAFIKETCTKLTDGYLAPVQLRDTTLTLTYNTVSLPSWAAGSHLVACNIGATLGNGGWATLLNSAKGPLLINGQNPVPPPDIPPERLNLPPVPMPGSASGSGSSSQSGSSGSSSGSGSSSSGGSQSGSGSSSSGSSQSGSSDSSHLPRQTATATQAPAPPQSNTVNPAPPEAPAAPAAPEAPAPPMDGVVGPAPGPAPVIPPPA